MRTNSIVLFIIMLVGSVFSGDFQSINKGASFMEEATTSVSGTFLGAVQANLVEQVEPGIVSVNLNFGNQIVNVKMDSKNFEKAFMPTVLSNKLVQDDINGFILGIKDMKVDDNTTIMLGQQANGFQSCHLSACVDPAEYDHNIGEQVTLNKTKTELWPRLGFVLAWARNGLTWSETMISHLSRTDRKILSINYGDDLEESAG